LIEYIARYLGHSITQRRFLTIAWRCNNAANCNQSCYRFRLEFFTLANIKTSISLATRQLRVPFFSDDEPASVPIPVELPAPACCALAIIL
jgi:hypothetical protein